MKSNQRTAIALWVVLCALSGCSSPGRVRPSARELSGTKAERAAAIARLIPSTAPYAELADAIEDARLIELKFGDGVLGPADYCSYLWIEIAPDRVGRWQSVLQPTTDAPSYDLPPTNPSWWLTRTDFDRIPKYEAFPLFMRDGWIAVADDRSHIFARACTR